MSEAHLFQHDHQYSKELRCVYVIFRTCALALPDSALSTSFTERTNIHRSSVPHQQIIHATTAEAKSLQQHEVLKSCVVVTALTYP